jgi:arginase family enzyme
MEAMNRPALFGTALDADDGPARVTQKAEYARLDGSAAADGAPRNPYQVLVPYLVNGADAPYRAAGEVSTPSWLTPFPAAADLPRLRPEAFRTFVYEGGCTAYARSVEIFAKELASAGPIAMLGVDHSATGGVVTALSAIHGPENLALIVVDAHLDAVSDAARSGLLGFAREHPDPAYRLDPGEYAPLASTHTSYNCGSFLRHLVESGVLSAQNLLVLGVADTPHPRLNLVLDPRVRRFLNEYEWLAAHGAAIIDSATLTASGRTAAVAAAAVARLPGRRAYLSWDLDVGSQRALVGVRYAELPGLDETNLRALAHGISEGLVAGGHQLVGLDVMEFDFYAAGAELPGGKDRTYDIAHALLTEFCPALSACEGSPRIGNTKEQSTMRRNEPCG